MTTGDTIFALSSGHGRAGVAVIRVSGPSAGVVIERMAAPTPKPRFAAFRTIKHPDSGEVLDQALVLWFPGPKSESGEDMAELQVHGGRAVVGGVLAAIGSMEGCRLAEPGEFARRAFENGKLDLTGVEGLADLIDAETAAQRRQALRQAEGGLARLYGGWRRRLIEAMALLEAAIDFSDEGDVAHDAEAIARSNAASLRDAISAHLDDGYRGELVRDGFQVVLAGAPNAGKSSLLNALARRNVAIVSDEAGTTRDIIEVKLDLEGLPVVVSDTAGIREAAGKVEQEGVRRALQRARHADLVVWLVDATADPATLADAAALADPVVSLPNLGLEDAAVLRQVQDGDSVRQDGVSGPLDGASATKASVDQTLVVLSKFDLVDAARQPPVAGAIRLSVVTGEGIDVLTGLLAAAGRASMGSDEAPALTQARHRHHLEQCLASLRAGLAQRAGDTELVADDLRRAADALGRLTGAVDAEDVLDEVFGRFCIGK
jgi:tRNA modification GTPase